MDHLPLLMHLLLAAQTPTAHLVYSMHSLLPPTHSTHLRTSTTQTMLHLLARNSTMHSSLAPCIMKTLLLVLVSIGKSRGACESTIWGLVGADKDVI